MTIGQEQLMKMKGKGVDERCRPNSIFWRIIYNAFYLWLTAIIVICMLISIFG